MGAVDNAVDALYAALVTKPLAAAKRIYLANQFGSLTQSIPVRDFSRRFRFGPGTLPKRLPETPNALGRLRGIVASAREFSPGRTTRYSISFGPILQQTRRELRFKQDSPWTDDDVALVGRGVLVLCLVLLLARLFVRRSRLCRLASGERYEAARRLVNFISQTVLGGLYLYIMLTPSAYGSDILHGYSPFAHRTFLLAIAFFLFDTTLYVAHPSPEGGLVGRWIIHHFVTTAFLLWLVAFRRSSALPAAVFLVSNAAHPVADLRWLISTADVGGPRLSKAVETARAVVVAVTFLVPPPMLVVRAANEAGLPVAKFVLERMQPVCWGGSLLFYVPHVIIPISLARRLVRNWWDSSETTCAPEKQA